MESYRETSANHATKHITAGSSQMKPHFTRRRHSVSNGHDSLSPIRKLQKNALAASLRRLTGDFQGLEPEASQSRRIDLYMLSRSPKNGLQDQSTETKSEKLHDHDHSLRFEEAAMIGSVTKHLLEPDSPQGDIELPLRLLLERKNVRLLSQVSDLKDGIAELVSNQLKVIMWHESQKRHYARYKVLENEVRELKDVNHDLQQNLHELEATSLNNNQIFDSRTGELSLTISELETRLDSERSEKIRLQDDLEKALANFAEQENILKTSLLDIESQKNLSLTLREKEGELEQKLKELNSELVASDLRNQYLNELLVQKNEQCSRLTHTIAIKEESLIQLNEKFQSLANETRTLHQDMEAFESNELSYKSKIRELSLELERTEDSNKRLEKQAIICSQERDELNSKLGELLIARDNLSDMVEKLKEKVRQGELKIKQMEDAISSEGKKLSELKSQMLSLSEENSKLSSKLAQEAKNEASYLQQLKDLQNQIQSAQSKTDKRIQQIAEQLYHEYSKKHELKVAQLKKKHEMKLEEKSSQIQSLAHQVHILNQEKTCLLNLVESRK